MSRQIKHITDQWKRDKETLSRLKGKKRLEFLWDYYKIPIVTLGLIIVFTILALVIRAPQKGTAVYVVWVNAVSQDESTYFDECLARAGIDTEEEHADVSTSFSLGIPGNDAADAQTMQVLSALFGIGDLDLYIADPEHFELYAVKDAFSDLSELLPEDVFLAAGDRIYYTVKAGGELVPVGYRITEDSGAAKAGYLAPGTEAIAGILENALNRDTAVKLLTEMIRGDTE